MRYASSLIAVSDLERSKRLYQEVLGQKITLDIGWNVNFANGFSIQLNFDQLVSFDKSTIKWESHNFELYFEEDDFDGLLERLKGLNIEYVHPPRKYDWQQRVVRIYDPDRHIIEIGESMAMIVRRYLNQELSIEETAQVIQHPVEAVAAWAQKK